MDGTGGQSAEALGRSRGGFGTKIHAAVTPLGHPVALELTGSQASDSPRLPGLVAGVATDSVLADKGYDLDANGDAIRASRPGGTGRTRSLTTGTCTRSGAWSSGTLPGSSQYRRVATRYDKKAANFMGFVWVVSIGIMLV